MCVTCFTPTEDVRSYIRDDVFPPCVFREVFFRLKIRKEGGTKSWLKLKKRSRW